MTSLDAQANRGIRALTGRQVLVQVLTLGAGIALARSLTPAEFGIYFIASFFISTFAFFGDFGLGPSLIQRREELTVRDLRVAFTLQQMVTTAIVVLICALAPWLVRVYSHAPSETVWLIRALAFQLYLTSFRSLSMLQLERTLSYGRVAAIEAVEALVYQGIAVGLALSGFGVWSLVVAVLVRASLGCVIAFVLAPWRVGFAFDRATARGFLRFGVPFQLGALAQQAGGWVTPVLVGSLVGPNAVGLLTWASSNARKPLMVVENVMRVAFPYFSRIQEDRAEVERVLARYLRLLLLGCSAWLAGIIVAAPGLVPTIYGHKWTPALPALMVFAVSLCFDAVAWVLGISLVGIGRVGLNARANVTRTIAYVVLGVPLVIAFGFIGAAVAALVSAVAIMPQLLRGFGPGAPLRLLRPLLPAVAPPALGTTAGLLIGLTPLPEPVRSLVAGSACVASIVALALVMKLLPLPRRPRLIAAPETPGYEAAT